MSSKDKKDIGKTKTDKKPNPLKAKSSVRKDKNSDPLKASSSVEKDKKPDPLKASSNVGKDKKPNPLKASSSAEKDKKPDPLKASSNVGKDKKPNPLKASSSAEKDKKPDPLKASSSVGKDKKPETTKSKTDLGKDKKSDTKSDTEKSKSSSAKKSDPKKSVSGKDKKPEAAKSKSDPKKLKSTPEKDKKSDKDSDKAKPKDLKKTDKSEDKSDPLKKESDPKIDKSASLKTRSDLLKDKSEPLKKKLDPLKDESLEKMPDLSKDKTDGLKTKSDPLKDKSLEKMPDLSKDKTDISLSEDELDVKKDDKTEKKSEQKFDDKESKPKADAIGVVNFSSMFDSKDKDKSEPMKKTSDPSLDKPGFGAKTDSKSSDEKPKDMFTKEDKEDKDNDIFTETKKTSEEVIKIEEKDSMKSDEGSVKASMFEKKATEEFKSKDKSKEISDDINLPKGHVKDKIAKFEALSEKKSVEKVGDKDIDLKPDSYLASITEKSEMSKSDKPLDKPLVKPSAALSADERIEKDFTPQERKQWAETILGKSSTEPKPSDPKLLESKTSEPKIFEPKPLASTEVKPSEAKSSPISDKTLSDIKVAEDVNKQTKPEKKRVVEDIFRQQSVTADDKPSAAELKPKSSTDLDNRIFPQEIKHKMSGAKSYVSDEVPIETKRKVEKYLSKLEDQKLKLGKFKARGNYGYVVEGNYKDDKKIAIKIIDLDKSGKDVIEGDVNILRELKHDNIIELIHSVAENDVLFLVMPFSKCDLFEDIFTNGAVCERRARDIIRQLMSGLMFMHKKGYAHRDVKCENILVFDNKIKICDFDLTRKAVDEEGNPIVVNDKRGTFIYMAPELISGEGSKDLRLTDVWSTGVVLFVILTFTYPFGSIKRIGLNSEKALERMRFWRYYFPSECVPTPEGRGLIEQFLQFDQYSRPQMEPLLENKWFTIELPQTFQKFSISGPNRSPTGHYSAYNRSPTGHYSAYNSPTQYYEASSGGPTRSPNLSPTYGPTSDQRRHFSPYQRQGARYY